MYGGQFATRSGRHPWLGSR